jgi:hypothetical protein
MNRSNHLFTTSRTRNNSNLQLLTLEIIVTTNTKPRNNMKPLQTNPKSSMIQLIPRRPENSLAFIQNPDNVAIILVDLVASALHTIALIAIPALAMATTIIAAFNKTQSVIMRTPLQTLTFSVNAEPMKNHTSPANTTD